MTPQEMVRSHQGQKDRRLQPRRVARHGHCRGQVRLEQLYSQLIDLEKYLSGHFTYHCIFQVFVENSILIKASISEHT